MQNSLVSFVYIDDEIDGDISGKFVDLLDDNCCRYRELHLEQSNAEFMNNITSVIKEVEADVIIFDQKLFKDHDVVAGNKNLGTEIVMVLKTWFPFMNFIIISSDIDNLISESEKKFLRMLGIEQFICKEQFVYEIEDNIKIFQELKNYKLDKFEEIENKYKNDNDKILSDMLSKLVGAEYNILSDNLLNELITIARELK